MILGFGCECSENSFCVARNDSNSIKASYSSPVKVRDHLYRSLTTAFVMVFFACLSSSICNGFRGRSFTTALISIQIDDRDRRLIALRTEINRVRNKHHRQAIAAVADFPCRSKNCWRGIKSRYLMSSSLEDFVTVGSDDLIYNDLRNGTAS